MSDDVIKNPNRVPPISKQYEPEHIRLGKEPEIKDLKAGEFSGSPASRRGLNFTNQEVYDSVDGSIFDAEGKKIPLQDSHIIDNNEFVNFDGNVGQQTSPPVKQSKGSPNIGEYILMVFGKLIDTGSLEKIEERVRAIMYGEDTGFGDLKLDVDDIVVLKRVSIKIGVFLEE